MMIQQIIPIWFGIVEITFGEGLTIVTIILTGISSVFAIFWKQQITNKIQELTNDRLSAGINEAKEKTEESIEISKKNQAQIQLVREDIIQLRSNQGSVTQRLDEIMRRQDKIETRRLRNQ